MNRLYRFGLPTAILLLVLLPARAQKANPYSFSVSYDAAAQSGPLTGRAYVIITDREEPEPRLQTGFDLAVGVPFWGRNFSAVPPGEPIVFDSDAFGFPYENLADLPPGDYFVQGVINIYTRFERSDGNTVWMHNDQWEGQRGNVSPGNLYSAVRKVHIDPANPVQIELVCDQVIPPIEVPADTKWVKHVKFESKMISEFWGQPMYIGATILLPGGYDEHPDSRYPVAYIQGHFSTRNPHGFTTEAPVEGDRWGARGYEFHKFWTSDRAPRMFAVTFQHPTPFYDDSYAVNSENTGPYGDALLDELIAYIDDHFRTIKEPWARILTGGSTGGWESLAMQIYNPDFFGGTFSLCPDPVDFRYYELINIYDDDNAFYRDYHGIKADRPEARDTDGQVRYTVRNTVNYEHTLGDHDRSMSQWAAWEATYSPVGEDGFPQPLWDWRTGRIDHSVAETWRKYDLRQYLEENWDWLGRKLKGKLHIYTGDMDTYYLNNATVLLEEFLEGTTDPYYDGVVKYGDRQPHCWGPRGAELYGLFAEYLEKTAPAGEESYNWHY